jgi:hypothetical protein
MILAGRHAFTAANIVDREQIVNNEIRQNDGNDAMEIIRLPEGEAATVDSDCISIDTVEGGFRLTGSLPAHEESRALVDRDLYNSQAAAEAAGLTWASSCGVTTLYVALNSPGPA